MSTAGTIEIVVSDEAKEFAVQLGRIINDLDRYQPTPAVFRERNEAREWARKMYRRALKAEREVERLRALCETLR